MVLPLKRRQLLTRSALLGCSAAASPLITPMSFASAPWDSRLVVIILRGAMDGLDALRPYGDGNNAAQRDTAAGRLQAGSEDLDGFFCTASVAAAAHAPLATRRSGICAFDLDPVSQQAQPF